MEAELLLDCRNTHGEGIFWNAADQRVWWTDIHGQNLWWFEPETTRSGSIAVPERVCCFAPRAGGGYLLAFARGLAFAADPSVATETFFDFEPLDPATRLNDGRTDRQGRFVTGGMNETDGAPTSSVLQVDANGRVRPLFSGVSCANSICFSPDGGTMYFSDTPTRRIVAYAYDDATGALGEARLFADLANAPGMPDGSCVDAEGYVWNAAWDGGRVTRITPDGRIDGIISLPVRKVTNCAFGGSDLNTLFITTSRLGSDAKELDEEPAAGGLFAVKPGVRGVVDAAFAG